MHALPTLQESRQMAPPTAIDTSAAGQLPDHVVRLGLDSIRISSINPALLVSQPTPHIRTRPLERCCDGSFESRRTRPPSPHNITSSREHGHHQHFLSVPVQHESVEIPRNFNTLTPSLSSTWSHEVIHWHSDPSPSSLPD
jgi:hypothetical protein